MAFQSCELESFAVIGKEGSTLEGEGFIQRLWTQANRDFWQVEPLALRKGEEPVGFWGVMSDFSRSFAPWTEAVSYTHLDVYKRQYAAVFDCDRRIYEYLYVQPHER